MNNSFTDVRRVSGSACFAESCEVSRESLDRTGVTGKTKPRKLHQAS